MAMAGGEASGGSVATTGGGDDDGEAGPSAKRQRGEKIKNKSWDARRRRAAK